VNGDIGGLVGSVLGAVGHSPHIIGGRDVRVLKDA
jgi:hypothetical protein